MQRLTNWFKDWFNTNAHPNHAFSPLGQVGKVTQTLGQGRSGLVLIAGELWRAEILAQDGTDLPTELEAGSFVTVVQQAGLKLYVIPAPYQLARGWDTLDK